jgi:hypothetical protein
MTIYALEIPNDDAAVPRWLEEQLASPDLSQLVAELRAVESAEPTPSLNQLLGTSRDLMLEQGLGILSPEQRSQLLGHPELLYELQELVCGSGGDYWLKLLTRDSDRRAAQTQWPKIQQSIEPTAAPANGTMSRRSIVVAIMSLAAALLIGFFAMKSQFGLGSYGWNKPGVFDVALAKPAYLNHLADSANEWFDAKPTTAPQLATRMKEFRESCDKLIAAKHPQLPDADRDWLRERCGVWAKKIDASLAKLDADPSQLKAVNAEMDETVNKLITALRERAKA